MADAFGHPFMAQLLLEKASRVNKADLLAALRRRCGNVEPLDGNPHSDMLAFVYPDHPVTFVDKQGPSQSFMSISPTGIDEAKSEPALQQTWDWPEARSVVAACRATMLVMDLMSSGLEYTTRLAQFQNTVSAVLDVVPCLGLHWMPSQRFVSIKAYIESKQAETFDRLFPAVNVRMFNIANGAAGEILMDTMGLAAMGLPDLQCHFVGLDPSEIARILFNTAYYIYDNGDVLGDGHTVQGIQVKDRWKCQHEDALVEPDRVVVDINPGSPHGRYPEAIREKDAVSRSQLILGSLR